MPVTYDDIRATFPILSRCTEQQITSLLCAELYNYGEQFGLAERVARAIISHIDDEPYSSLTNRGDQNRRATIDAFLQFATPRTAPGYLRAIGAASDYDKSPGWFRRKLATLAKHRSLLIPDTFLAYEIPTEAQSKSKSAAGTMISMRLPRAVIDRLNSEATARGMSRSALVKDLIYDFIGGSLKCSTPFSEEQ